MPRYLVQASYSSEGTAAMISNPVDRAAVIRQLLESVGGKLETYDFAFGDYDVVVVCELPDNVTMAALSMAVSASGVAKAIKTTPLLSVEEAMEAMQKAGEVGYQPPT